MKLLLISFALLAVALPLPAGETALTSGLVSEPFSLQFSQVNATKVESHFSMKTGTLWKSADGASFIILRTAETVVPAQATAALVVPAAALSAKSAWTIVQSVSFSEGTDPRVAPLLSYLATRNDIPRETSQLVVLVLTENIGFADWQKYLAATRSERAAAPTGDTAVALDALTILRAIAPKGEFALAGDGALKLRALHDPLLRGKAMQVFGLVIPGDATAGGVAPDLGQLLHSKPGDNCPICRLRGQMQRPGEIP